MHVSRKFYEFLCRLGDHPSNPYIPEMAEPTSWSPLSIGTTDLEQNCFQGCMRSEPGVLFSGNNAVLDLAPSTLQSSGK